MSLPSGFWSKVEKTDTCWLWTGRVNAPAPRDYGILSVKGRNCLVHRLMYAEHVGDPTGKSVCHHCDVARCVNPAHLFLGTQSENMKDASRKGRLGMQQDPSRSHFRRAGWSKLTDRHVAEIRVLIAQGVGGRPIADAFGVSLDVIHGIRCGKRWKHVAASESI
jgi:hypothetical protein